MEVVVESKTIYRLDKVLTGKFTRARGPVKDTQEKTVTTETEQREQ